MGSAKDVQVHIRTASRRIIPGRHGFSPRPARWVRATQFRYGPINARSASLNLSDAAVIWCQYG